MFYGVSVKARLHDEEYRQAERIVQNAIEEGDRKYQSMSHFIRVAVNQLVRKEKLRGKPHGHNEIRRK